MLWKCQRSVASFLFAFSLLHELCLIMAQAEDYILGRSYSEGLRQVDMFFAHQKPTLRCNPLNVHVLTSCRLETQHLLFGIHNGSTMNPKIPITPESKIADVGTGTGYDTFLESSQ